MLIHHRITSHSFGRTFSVFNPNNLQYLWLEMQVQSTHHSDEIFKRSVLCAVRPTVHIKQSFSQRSSNWLCVKVWTDSILKTELFQNRWRYDDPGFLNSQPKGPFTRATFVAAARCNFCRTKVASSFKRVRNPCDIAATNRTEIAPGLHVRFWS